MARTAMWCRAIRNQQFIRFTKADLAQREAKMRGAADAYWEAHPRHRLPQVALVSRRFLVFDITVCKPPRMQLRHKGSALGRTEACCCQQACASPATSVAAAVPW
jgi:hypothetical protein